jgi:hypothetical protein
LFVKKEIWSYSQGQMFVIEFLISEKHF